MAKPSELQHLISEVHQQIPGATKQLETIAWAYKQLVEDADNFRCGDSAFSDTSVDRHCQIET